MLMLECKTNCQTQWCPITWVCCQHQYEYQTVGGGGNVVGIKLGWSMRGTLLHSLNTKFFFCRESANVAPDWKYPRELRIIEFWFQVLSNEESQFLTFFGERQFVKLKSERAKDDYYSCLEG